MKPTNNIVFAEIEATAISAIKKVDLFIGYKKYLRDCHNKGMYFTYTFEEWFSLQ